MRVAQHARIFIEMVDGIHVYMQWSALVGVQGMCELEELPVTRQQTISVNMMAIVTQIQTLNGRDNNNNNNHLIIQ